MPCNYLSAPRCGLIEKMIEPKVLKISYKTFLREQTKTLFYLLALYGINPSTSFSFSMSTIFIDHILIFSPIPNFISNKL